MYNNVTFSGIGIYHPKNEVPNSFFVEHFKKMDIEVEPLMNHLGRKVRYFADEGKENVVTMAYEASLEAISYASINAEEIDAIIFATDTPEYLCPSNALLLNDKLKATNAHLVFDINSNCIGMLTAIDVASRILRSNDRINRVLIAGSLYASLISSKIDPVVYSNFADSGAALILEKKTEPVQRGFIDSNFKTDPVVKDKFVMPKAGFSNIYNDDVYIEDKKFRLDPFDTSFVAKEWVELITEMLERNDRTVEEINHYLFSQFSKPDAELALEMLGADKDKHTFVGDRYGYTGVTSPIMALYEAVNNNRINTGDNVVLCSVGAGYNISSILYRF